MRDFDTYKTLVCNRNPKLEAGFRTEKLSYLQYAYMQFMAQTRARPSVEPNVLDLLVQHQHKALLTTLPLVQGLLDHKWYTFARQLLTSWGIIMLLVFVIYEINVYSDSSLAASPDFTLLEIVTRAALTCCAYSSDSTFPGSICICSCDRHHNVFVSSSLGHPPERQNVQRDSG